MDGRKSQRKKGDFLDPTGMDHRVNSAANMHYSSRKGKNVPEGNLQTLRAASLVLKGGGTHCFYFNRSKPSGQRIGGVLSCGASCGKALVL